MNKKSFVPRSDNDRRNWLNNFALKLYGYSGRFGISTTEVDIMSGSSQAVGYWLDYQNRANQYNQQITQFKNELLNGLNTGARPTSQPSQPETPSCPWNVEPDVMGRAVSIGNRIKSHQDYTEAIGRDLGLIGAEIITEREVAKPMLSIRLIGGGQPELVWKKADMDGIEIYKLDTNGHWTLLAYDSYPNYTDSTPLPLLGLSAVWQYKAIYRFHDAQVGEWSDVISVKVAGELDA